MKISFSKTAFLHLLHPASGVPIDNDNGEPVGFTIFSSQSPEYKKAKNRAMNRTIKGKGKGQTAESISSESNQLMTECVESLSGFEGLEIDGMTDVNKEKLPELLERQPWIKDQLDGAFGDFDLFT